MRWSPFENFNQEFGVDITVLNEDWERHFGPESGANPIVLIIVGLSVGFGVIAHSEVPAVPFWVRSILFLVPTLYILWKINPVSPRIVPITIRDLVNAVRAGRWFLRSSWQLDLLRQRPGAVGLPAMNGLVCDSGR
jgi:hypothetical protein